MILHHGWTFRIVCLMKKLTHSQSHAVWFLLHTMPRMIKSIQTQRNWWPVASEGPALYRGRWMNCSAVNFFGMMRHSKMIQRWLYSMQIISHWTKCSKWANCLLGEIGLDKDAIKNKIELLFLLFLLANPRASSGKCYTTDFIPTLELIFLVVCSF